MREILGNGGAICSRHSRGRCHSKLHLSFFFGFLFWGFGFAGSSIYLKFDYFIPCAVRQDLKVFVEVGMCGSYAENLSELF